MTVILGIIITLIGFGLCAFAVVDSDYDYADIIAPLSAILAVVGILIIFGGFN